MCPKRTLPAFRVKVIIAFVLWISSWAEADSGCGYSFTHDQHSGAIYSANFPFAYRTGQSCEYKFYSPKGQPQANKVCFTFLRFRLRGNVSTSCDDYLEFPGSVRFCGSGERERETKLTDNQTDTSFAGGGDPGNVWNKLFCWRATEDHSPLIVRFVRSADSSAGRGLSGFYAEFRVWQWEAEDKTGQIGCDHSLQSTDHSATSGGRLYVPGCLITCPNGNICDTSIDANCTCEDTAPCPDDQFTCFNRKCVTSQEVCNGKDNCGDDSDENYEHARCNFKDPGLFAVPVCDFELGGSCGFLGMKDWIIESAMQSGLSPDHTLGLNGHYLRANFRDGAPPNTTIEFYVQDNSGLLSHGACLSFWYSIRNPGSGHIRVLLGQTEIWKSSYGRGDWHSASVSLTTQLRVTFQAEKGCTDGLIALDDIYVQKGNCHQVMEPMCTFEINTCGWTQEGNPIDTERGTQSSWQVVEDETITTGRFLYIEADDDISENDHISLHSPYISPNEWEYFCLRFRLYLSCPGVEINIIVAKATTEEGTHVLKIDNGTVGDWHDIQGSLQLKDLAEVIIRLSILKQRCFVALDDIHISGGKCSSVDVEEKTTAEITTAGSLTTTRRMDTSRHTTSRSEGLCPEGLLWCARKDRCVSVKEWCDTRDDCGGSSEKHVEHCPDDPGTATAKSLSTLAILVTVAVAVILILVVVSLTIVYKCSRRRTHSSRRQSSNTDGSSEITQSEDVDSSIGNIGQEAQDSWLPPAYYDNPTLVNSDVCNHTDVNLPKYEFIHMDRVGLDGDTLVFERTHSGLRSFDHAHAPRYRVRYLPGEHTHGHRDPPPRYSTIIRNGRAREPESVPGTVADSQAPVHIADSNSNECSGVVLPENGRPSIESGNVFTISGRLPTYEQVLQEVAGTNASESYSGRNERSTEA